MKLFKLLVCISSLFGIPNYDLEKESYEEKVSNMKNIEFVYIDENDEFMFSLIKHIMRRYEISYLLCARKTTESDRKSYLASDSKEPCPKEVIVTYDSRFNKFYNYENILKHKKFKPVAFVKLKETDYVKRVIPNYRKYYLAFIDSLENTSAKNISDVKIKPINDIIYCLHEVIFCQCRNNSENYYSDLCKKTFSNETYNLGLQLYEELCFTVDIPLDNNLRIIYSGIKHTYEPGFKTMGMYERRNFLGPGLNLKYNKDIYNYCLDKIINYDSETLLIRSRHEMVYKLCNHVIKHRCFSIISDADSNMIKLPTCTIV